LQNGLLIIIIVVSVICWLLL